MTKNVFTEGNSQEEDFNVDQSIGREIGAMLEHSYALGYLVGQKNGRKQGYESGYDCGFEKGYNNCLSGENDFCNDCVGCPEHGCVFCCKMCENPCLDFRTGEPLTSED